MSALVATEEFHAELARAEQAQLTILTMRSGRMRLIDGAVLFQPKLSAARS